MKRYTFYLLLLTATLLSCSQTRNLSQADSDNIEITFLQMNDVYEISPLEDGKVGGLARVATVRNRLLDENPNTYTVIAGDFLSPSLIGTLKQDGERIKGKHMVDVLNTLGLDLACFGNHEFDIKEQELQDRLNESTFDWISGNVKHVKSKGVMPFEKIGQGPIPEYVEWTVPNTDVQIGIFTACINSNRQDYVDYSDAFEHIDKAIHELGETSEVLIGLTHLDVDDDLIIAERYPEVDLIMGGHDHTNMLFGRGNATIAKADANAKTVYVHRISFNTKTGDTKVNSDLVRINESIVSDPKTQLVVDKWNGVAQKSFDELGFDPNEILAELSDPLDARESLIRFKPAPFCQLIARAMNAASPESEAAILNSGSVRVDDVLTGTLTQYDILRSLPFGGGVVDVDMKGSLLLKILDTGWNNVNDGGFLQWAQIERDNESWLINGQPIDQQSNYRVTMTDFLMTGLESGLDFLKEGNPDIIKIYDENRTDTQKDIRNAVIDYLKNGGR